jgi:hypothetical protein
MSHMSSSSILTKLFQISRFSRLKNSEIFPLFFFGTVIYIANFGLHDSEKFLVCAGTGASFLIKN